MKGNKPVIDTGKIIIISLSKSFHNNVCDWLSVVRCLCLLVLLRLLWFFCSTMRCVVVYPLLGRILPSKDPSRGFHRALLMYYNKAVNACHTTDNSQRTTINYLCKIGCPLFGCLCYIPRGKFCNNPVMTGQKDIHLKFGKL